MLKLETPTPGRQLGAKRIRANRFQREAETYIQFFISLSGILYLYYLY
jgi:hypothetical protein